MLTKKGRKEDNVPEPQFKVHPGDIMIRFTAPKGFAELGAKDDNHVTQNDQESDQAAMQETVQNTMQNTVQAKKMKLLKFCKVAKSRNEMQKYIGLKNRSHFVQEYLHPLLNEKLLKMTLPDKPSSRNQRYITTQKGQDLLGE